MREKQQINVRHQSYERIHCLTTLDLCRAVSFLNRDSLLFLRVICPWQGHQSYESIHCLTTLDLCRAVSLLNRDSLLFLRVICPWQGQQSYESIHCLTTLDLCRAVNLLNRDSLLFLRVICPWQGQQSYESIHLPHWISVELWACWWSLRGLHSWICGLLHLQLHWPLTDWEAAGRLDCC